MTTIWRGWSLLAGLPLGALAAWALLPPPPGARALLGGALLTGVALAVAVGWISRRLGGGLAREARLATAVAVGFAGLPALAACALGLAPGPVAWLVALAVALALALARAARRAAPPAAPGSPLVAAPLAALAGTLAIAAAASLAASWGAPRAAFSEERARAVFDLDASVVTLPLPRCGAAPARVEVLLARGARPRFGPEGRVLWFDAAGPEGRRQVHRLELASGRVSCWTCGEPGQNLRPFPGGASLVFETDRHATWWDPTNTEIHLIGARGERPDGASRRLTWSPGPDDHALLGFGSRVLVWSSGAGGRYAVVSATFRSGHGALLLGSRGFVALGGARWVAPLAWSPDARSLVVVSGNPFRPLAARALDLATDESFELGAGVAAGAGADFNADGGWLALAEARHARSAGLLPDRLGFLLAPFATAIERGAPLLRGSGVRSGPPRGEGAALELGEVARWGEPTGVALSADARSLVLGQRRGAAGAVEERLLRLPLACEDAPRV